MILTCCPFCSNNFWSKSNIIPLFGSCSYIDSLLSSLTKDFKSSKPFSLFIPFNPERMLTHQVEFCYLATQKTPLFSCKLINPKVFKRWNSCKHSIHTGNITCHNFIEIPQPQPLNLWANCKNFNSCCLFKRSNCPECTWVISWALLSLERLCQLEFTVCLTIFTTMSSLVVWECLIYHTTSLAPMNPCFH